MNINRQNLDVPLLAGTLGAFECRRLRNSTLYGRLELKPVQHLQRDLDRVNLSRYTLDYLKLTIGVMWIAESQSDERSGVTMMRFMDPFEEIGRMMGSFGGGWPGGIMPMDAFDHGGVYTLRFDLPGVNPDTVDLTVEGNVLTVTAERPVEETKDVTWLLRERPAGTHRREVRLGDGLDTSQVNANYDNGVLTVTIPIREEVKPHKVSISSGTGQKLTAGASS